MNVPLPRRPQWLSNLLAALFLLVATAPDVHAHAFLARADPGVGCSLRQLPREVRLTFTEELEPAFSSAKVSDAAGRQVDGKDVHLDPKDPHVLIVSLPAPLSAGTYKVTWKVVSKDTHVTQGSFTFTKEP